jgi:hypothetical protein
MSSNDLRADAISNASAGGFGVEFRNSVVHRSCWPDDRVDDVWVFRIRADMK